jgi:hypothetical protein
MKPEHVVNPEEDTGRIFEEEDLSYGCIVAESLMLNLPGHMEPVLISDISCLK